MRTSRKQKRTIRLLGRSQKTELFLNSRVILTASYKFSTQKRIYDHHTDNDAKEESKRKWTVIVCTCEQILVYQHDFEEQQHWRGERWLNRGAWSRSAQALFIDSEVKVSGSLDDTCVKDHHRWKFLDIISSTLKSISFLI